MTRQVRVALWAGSSLDNVGDRLIASVTEAELARRLPGVSVRHFCPWAPDGPGNIAPLWVDAAGGWPGAGQFDAVVVAGGGVWSGPPFRHPIMQIFCLGRDPVRFDPPAWVAWHGVGLQDATPAPSLPQWVEYLGQLRDRLDFVAIRSPDAAQRWAQATGSCAAVVPDPVFALPPAPRPPRPPRAAARRLRVGVAVGSPEPSPRLISRLASPGLAARCRFDRTLCLSPDEVVAAETSGPERDRRASFLTAVARGLARLRRGADIDLLAVDNIYADDELAARLHAVAPGTRLRRLPADDADGLTRTFTEYDAVVLSRFHSVVLAMRSATPVVVLDPYRGLRTGTSKLHQLTGEVGLRHRYWAAHPDQPADVDLGDLVADAARAAPVEGEGYDTQHRLALASFDRLADALATADRRRLAGSGPSRSAT